MANCVYIIHSIDSSTLEDQETEAVIDAEDREFFWSEYGRISESYGPRRTVYYELWELDTPENSLPE